MSLNKRPPVAYPRQLIFIVTLGILPVFIILTFAANITPASANPLNLSAVGVNTPPASAALQIEPTGVFSFSLATLGYGERALNSPFDSAKYIFRIPDNWQIQTDGILELDLSYFYSQLSNDEYPALFGNLTVTLDDQVLEIFPVNEEFDQLRLRILIPAALLNKPEQPRHVIEVIFDAGLLCTVPHKGALSVKPTSSVTLNYQVLPLEPDLARYPWPLYQRAFEPDVVGFVLPPSPSIADMASALAVAAKLGDLTNNQVAISDTTEIDLNSLAAGEIPESLDKDLIVIGRPDDNPLLARLNETADLPVSLHQRRIPLTIRGPAAIAPGEPSGYNFTVTNTISRPVDLSAVVSISTRTALVDCLPDCVENPQDNSIRWRDISLAPDESINLSVTLKTTNSLTSTVLANYVTLLEATLGPVNADVFTSTVTANPDDNELEISLTEENGYFFLHNGQPVAKEDGIIQEIVSPWYPNQAIIIVTGLNDAAVEKAGHALGSRARFPGMSGQVALVQNATLTTANTPQTTAPVEQTFEEMGYPDQVIRGVTGQAVTYEFFIPLGWQLTDEAYIDLYFSHSQLIDYATSGLTVFLNGTPVASQPLDNQTAGEGYLRIGLGDANIRNGRDNRLAVQVNMALQGENCSVGQAEQAWALIKSSSKISLPHNESTGVELNLDYYPYPFHLDTTLQDTLFVLPDEPTALERETILRLAAALGNASGGKTLVPAVTTGSLLEPDDMANYHLIAAGRPTRNRLIQQVNNSLPQPFIPGSDEIEQKLDDVVFRLPPNVDLGYIELIRSPWNENRGLLAVTGTTDNGFYAAANILANRPWVLGNGNLALVRQDGINTIDTRRLTNQGAVAAIATIVPELTPEVNPTPTVTPTLPAATPAALAASPNNTGDKPAPTPAQERAELPNWLIPLVGVNGFIIVAILAIAFWKARQRKQ